MRNIIAANWKMNFGVEKAENTAKDMVEKIKKSPADILVCASFVHLDRLSKIFKDSIIKLGAQNMHFEEKGAFTGETSPVMLKSVNCEYVILGHSERRHIFKEDDGFINKKVKSALTHGLTPILCVGETLDERNNDQAFDVVSRQIKKGLESSLSTSDVIVAYEPVWAIGTGVAADIKTVSKMHDFIRSIVKNSPILYGGSVKPENAEELSQIENVDGFLVGGASLKTEDFKDIIEKFTKVKWE